MRFFLVLLSVMTSSLAFADYKISGECKSLGKYSGEAFVKENLVERIAVFSSARFKNLKIQSLWQGRQYKGKVVFEIRDADYITSADGFTTATPFKSQRLNVLLEDQVQLAFSDCSEKWERIFTLAPHTFWKQERTVKIGRGEDYPLISFAAHIGGIYQLINHFRDLPELEKYKEREEFVSKDQYFVIDHTDYNFYQNNRDVVRVVNKTINPLSLAESLMRRNAFAHTLNYKAEKLNNDLIAYNLNLAGLLEFAKVDERGNKTGRLTEYDSALWTSMFGASELLRFKTTKDPSAVENFRKVLDGILTLIEITGDEREFARTLKIKEKNSVQENGFVDGAGAFQGLEWRQGGNNDMLKGLFLTYIIAHEIKDQLSEVERQRLKSAAARLPHLKVATERKFNFILALGIDALWNKNEESFNQYIKKTFDLRSKLERLSGLEDGIYYEGITDWSGVNLSMTSNLCSLFLARELQTEFTSGKLREAEREFDKKLYLMTKTYELAHRDYLKVAAYAFSQTARQDESFTPVARDALWILKETPYPRFTGRVEIDYQQNPNWSASAWPRLPWKAIESPWHLKDDKKIAELMQGAYSYPIYESFAWSSDYFWKDGAFPVKITSNPDVALFGADYLFMYWAARASGLVHPEE